MTDGFHTGCPACRWMPDFAYLGADEDASRELIHESVVVHIVDTDDELHNRLELTLDVDRGPSRTAPLS